MQIDCSQARLPTGMTLDRRRLAVLVLAFVALVLRDSSLPHQHAGIAPGLYNHDHDLCTLATVAGGLVPDVPQSGPVLVALPTATAVAVAVRAAAPRCLADPRAPPHREPSRDS